MSIVRVGMSESKSFGDGYDAIFGNKKKPTAKPVIVSIKKPTPKKAPAKKGKKA